MAVLASTTMGEAQQESKMVHPFFMKRPKSTEDLLKVSQDIPVTVTSAIDIQSTSLTDTGFQNAGSMKVGRGRPRKNGPENEEREAGAELLEVDPNLDRRKRRKSASEEDNLPENGSDFSSRSQTASENENTKQRDQLGEADIGNNGVVLGLLHVQVGASDAQNVDLGSIMTNTSRETNLGTDLLVPPSRISQVLPAADPQMIEVHLPLILPSQIDTPKPTPSYPRKMLQLNSKTGTIGSPPKPKPTAAEEPHIKTRKPRASKVPKSMIVTIPYGYDLESRIRIGGKLDRLMKDGASPLPNLSKVAENVPIQSSLLSAQGPSKSTHPFFLGKVAPIPEISQTPAIVDVDMTLEPVKASPLKMLKMFTTPRPFSPAKHTKGSSGGFGHAFGNSSKIMKFPGAIEPCWPPRQMMHLRGFNDEGDTSVIDSLPSDPVRIGRKAKGATVQVPVSEEIIREMIPGLHITEVAKRLSQTNSDEFVKPDELLRVPKRHFESGIQLQKQIRHQLFSHLPISIEGESSEDEITTGTKRETKIHPALEQIYSALPTSLTAFDRSTYETQSWVHKYAPKSAAEVLQTGKEAFILKDWLLALTVVAVDTGISENRSRAGSVASKRSAEKRKRKSKKLDGFIISSDEEYGDMDEISEPDDDVSPRGSQGLLKRTVIRAGDTTKKDSGKLANALLISGPSGCGKTATVYAVAKELGFEVFEINSGSRRSGKDILEKVGDMTRNHQVQRSKQGPARLADDDVSDVSEALAEDLRSGRQGTMNSFFKPKAAKALPPKELPKREEKPVKPLPKKQKQSLILLEEVDVLFEEDKQFWATIMTLIAQSKRPIIMTCTDETLVPVQALILHAILRLTPPPLETTIDYLLLVAAAEGHIIQRKAVQTLFEAKGLDLRATMTDLDYWCQLGVGDCKGGMDWFYLRWPPGSDIDNHGNAIRVVSEGTYETGMGWLGRDFLCSHGNRTDVRNELLNEVWDGWQLDISPLEGMDPQLMTLNSYEDLIQSMSAADVSACGRLATGNQTLLDTTQPPMPVKFRDDFILGRTLLDADVMKEFDSTASSIAFCIQTLAQNHFESASTSSRLDGSTSQRIVKSIAGKGIQHNGCISRLDFSVAFDPIAEPERKYSWSIGSLEPSVFDRTTTMIAVDVAPYVRSIVAYDAWLQQERAQLSNLMSEGGRKGKRMRTTRAALSALEGGARNTTRPERYFGPTLNPLLVLKTGLQSWQDAISADLEAGYDKESQGERDSTPHDISKDLPRCI